MVTSTIPPAIGSKIAWPLGIPGCVIHFQVWHYGTGWHLCWHLNPWHKDWKGSGNVRTNKEVNHSLWYFRTVAFLSTASKTEQIQCTKIQWLARRDVGGYEHCIFSFFSSNNSQNRLISASSATGCHTGISDGDAGSAEESGPTAKAEECWPVLLLKSEMDQISQVDTGHSGYRDEMRYTLWLRLSYNKLRQRSKHTHAMWILMVLPNKPQKTPVNPVTVTRNVHHFVDLFDNSTQNFPPGTTRGGSSMSSCATGSLGLMVSGLPNWFVLKKSKIGRPSILEVSVAISTVTICQQTSLNLRPRDLSSTCQSKKLHDTKNPPKSSNILELLYDVHVIMLSVSLCKYNVCLERHIISALLSFAIIISLLLSRLSTSKPHEPAARTHN